MQALPLIVLNGLWVLLAPVLAWQGLFVRRHTARLPEATGVRLGVAGSGPVRLRVLIVGDSSAAGVGASTQHEALAGQLAQALVNQGFRSVAWQLVARTGDTAQSARPHVAATLLRRADVLVTVFGVNESVERQSPSDYLAALDALVGHVNSRTGARFIVHCSPPCMGVMPALPQPLRWMLGLTAAGLDRALQRHVLGYRRRTRFVLPFDPVIDRAADWLAPDGFHPNPALYARWAAALAEHIDVDVHTVPESRAVRPSGFHSLFDQTLSGRE